MSIDELWIRDEVESTQGKTFWLKASTLAKIKALQACAGDPDKIIRRIKLAIEKEVDELYEMRPRKSEEKSGA